VTPRCPCSCWHCSFAHRAESELSLDTLREAIAGVQELGTSVIGLTGGEPLLREDLEEIIHAIGDLSMPLLFTTGHQLSRERVRALADAGLGIPVISLDHYRAEVHDRRRGREGVHAGAVRAIELFREEGFYVAVSFVPDRELIRNPSELERTLAFFRELGVNDMRLTSPILSGHLTARHDTLLSEDDVRKVWEVQERLTRTPGEPGVFAYDYFEHEQLYGCGAGYNYLFIDAEGNACPCDFAMLSFGNIRERPVADIWRDTSARFRAPGRTCYANVISDSIAASGSDRRPLDPEQSQAIIDQHPPFDRDRLPVFYEKFGLEPGG
jgi:MoaA/NifB/PqqE/SkfB family radical SAM enzyme